MDTATAALIAAAAVTAGWVYTARRARTLSRKQHTVAIMLQANFNKELQEAFKLIVPHVNGKELQSIDEAPEEAIRRILNHMEFMAAGIRMGVFDEQLVRSDRSRIIGVYAMFNTYIWSLRNDRQRMSLYEDLEWLHNRWTDPKQKPVKSAIEWMLQRPLQRSRYNYDKTFADNFKLRHTHRQ